MSSKVKTSTKKIKKQQEEIEGDASLSEHIRFFWQKYSTESTPLIKVIDWFILYLLLLIGLQLFYRIIQADDFPKNSFYAGILTPLGVIVLLVSLRVPKRNFRMLGQFFIATLCLFIVAINFVG